MDARSNKYRTDVRSARMRIEPRRYPIYTYSDAQKDAAEASRAAYAPRLSAAGYGEITTEIVPAPVFYHAEDYHQQYLAKNPAGYCGIGGTGVSCPVGLGVA